MKKTRMLSRTAAAAIVLIGFVPVTSGNLAANFVFFGADSPVVVGDGSIYGDVQEWSWNYWREKTKKEMYTANATDRDYIRFEGFTNKNSGARPPSSLTGTGGWLILISTWVPNTTQTNPNSIAFCSTAMETPQPSCMLGTPDPKEKKNWVYLETHPDQDPQIDRHRPNHGRWGASSFLPKTLKFHDTHDNCDKDTGDNESNCDHIYQITIQTMNHVAGADGDTYQCDRPGACNIQVGPPT
jgi:hypothetical protein